MRVLRIHFITALGLLLGLSACGDAAMGTYSTSDSVNELDAQASQVRWDQLQILFPVVGKVSFEDDWQDPRGGGKRRHEGTDLIAKKLTPVVAITAGTVSKVRAQRGGDCCYIELTHESQGRTFTSRYLHLNNDTPGTDDGNAIGIASEIRRGIKVQAGQLIGWVGDSGNAENTVPHLHFELRDEFARAVNPYLIVSRAKHLDRVLY